MVNSSFGDAHVIVHRTDRCDWDEQKCLLRRRALMNIHVHEAVEVCSLNLNLSVNAFRIFESLEPLNAVKLIVR